MKRKLDIPSKLMTESPQEAEKDLIEIKKENALQAFETGEGLDDIIERARQTVADFEHDMSTAAGRKRSASLAYKVARLKTRLDDLRKDLVSDKKALINKVDKHGRYLRDELDKVKKEARKVLDDWEAEEELRIENIQGIIRHIKDLMAFDVDRPALEELERRLEEAQAQTFDGGVYGEFEKQARLACTQTIAHLEITIEAEKARLELEQMRKEKEARELKEAEERAELERKEEEERAERERLENEKRLALEEKQRIEAATKEAAELAAKLEREKQLARFREEQEETARKMREERVKAEKELKRRQEEKEAAIEKARKAEEKAKKAEFDRMVSEAQARANEEFAAKQAVLDEQKRIADLKAKEEAKQTAKEANKKHVAKIDKEAFDALFDIIDHPFDNPKELTDSILVAIKEGNVEHVTIKY